MLLCVLLQTVIGKDWGHSFIEPDWKHVFRNTLQSQEILNRPVVVLDILSRV
jgi:hypothetical protein